MQRFVFDLDGTLVDSFQQYFGVLSQIFAQSGLPFTLAHQHECVTCSPKDFLHKYIGETQSAAQMDFVFEKAKLEVDQVFVFEGIRETLEDIRAKNRPMAIWTGRDFATAMLILESKDLKKYFGSFVSGTCVKQNKPNSEGLGRILKEWSSPSDEVIMVGDHEHDMIGATDMKTFAVRAAWHGHWEFQKCHRADWQFDKVSSFHTWVQSIL